MSIAVEQAGRLLGALRERTGSQARRLEGIRLSSHRAISPHSFATTFGAKPVVYGATPSPELGAPRSRRRLGPLSSRSSPWGTP